MQRIAAFVLMVLCLSAMPAPCLWDRDTLRYEAKGLPGIIEVITGRFEREPDRLYELRLERVTAELVAEPRRLDLYDDAGVACDRLHRGDEAIAWMARKFAALAEVADSPAKSEALYRYHANLGTFLAHRWLRGGADRTQLDELREGREHIERALELNSDAHFGRETYQAVAMDWLITLPTPEDPGVESFEDPWTLFDASPPDLRGGLRASNIDGSARDLSVPAAATAALAGLIVLGDAWQSIDVFNALARSLELQGHSTLAYFALLRARELALSGKRSLHPDFAAADPELAARLEYLWLTPSHTQPLEEVEDFFASARAEAEAWQVQRTNFALRRLDEGRHPDTDPKFWDGYDAPMPPVPPGALISGDAQLDRKVFTGLALFLAAVAGVVYLAIRTVLRALRRRAA